MIDFVKYYSEAAASLKIVVCYAKRRGVRFFQFILLFFGSSDVVLRPEQRKALSGPLSSSMNTDLNRTWNEKVRKEKLESQDSNNVLLWTNIRMKIVCRVYYVTFWPDIEDTEEENVSGLSSLWHASGFLRLNDAMVNGPLKYGSWISTSMLQWLIWKEKDAEKMWRWLCRNLDFQYRCCLQFIYVFKQFQRWWGTYQAYTTKLWQEEFGLCRNERWLGLL